jgi:hypothetical protein
MKLKPLFNMEEGEGKFVKDWSSQSPLRQDILDFSFKRAGIDRDRLHAALRIMGRKQLKSQAMEWSDDNPTRNYCYVVSEWLHRYYAPKGSLTFKVEIPGDEEWHRFNIWPDGAIVDLTCSQFSSKIVVPYHTATPFTLMQSGGPAPSRRAQLLQWIYKDIRPHSEFYVSKDKDNWKNPATPCLSRHLRLLDEWQDPYPNPVIKNYEGFSVVRDDLLGVGSKVRFIDALLYRYPQIEEWVYGSCPAQGYGQVSLAAACKRHDKEAVLFMAYRDKKNWLAQQKQGIKLGATYMWIKNGFLNVTEKRAQDYVDKHPFTRKLLGLGLNDPTIQASIIKVARSLPLRKVEEIWTVGGSGVLSRSLQMAFPHARVNIVSVGHTMKLEEIGRARLWRHPLKFTQDVPEEELPPYPSLRNYDAKIWSFAKKYGKPGALIWNVA